jgi:membrane-bound serine protease (ClpP class)
MFPSAAPGYRLSPVVIAGTVIVTAGFFLLVLSMLLRSRKRLVVTGREALLGAEGEAVAWWGEEGRVRIRVEIWRARAVKPLQPGTRVKVIDRDGLILIVEST